MLKTDVLGQNSITESLSLGWPDVDLGCPIEGLSGEPLISALASSRFQSLVIPQTFGGSGATLLELAAAQRAIARVDASAAIALNMHSLSVGLMVQHWQRNQDTSWFLLEGLVDQHALVASAFAERGSSSNLLQAGMLATPSTDGYVLNGRKYPCSLASSARLYCFSARASGTGNTIVGLCPANAPGIVVGETWNAIGMRASDTRSIEFHNVEVDRRLVFYTAAPSDLDDLAVTGIAWFAVLMGSTYHGLLTELVSIGLTSLQPRADNHRTASAVRAAAGRAAGALVVLGGALRDSARLFDDPDLLARPMLTVALALRSMVSRVVDEVASSSRVLLGSRAYASNERVAQLLLDAFAAHHHPPSLAVVDDLIASALVDEELTLEVER